jgi:hypothetical protein
MERVIFLPQTRHGTRLVTFWVISWNRWVVMSVSSVVSVP